MAINYRIVKVKNPKGIEGVTYLAGKAVKSSDYTYQELLEDIETTTTVTDADAAAVLKAIKKFIKKALLAGRRVVLEDIGALKINLRGKCYPMETFESDEFQPASMIKGIAVNFRAEAQMLKDLRANYKLNRVMGEFDKN